MTNDKMPERVWLIPYNSNLDCGEWDITRWTKCPYVENDTRPENEAEYIRADTIAAKDKALDVALKVLFIALEESHRSYPSYAAPKIREAIAQIEAVRK